MVYNRLEDLRRTATRCNTLSHIDVSSLFARDDGRAPPVAEVGAQLVGIVARVGAQAADPARRLGQHRWGSRHVAGVARRQQEDAGPPKGIGECVDLGRLTTARRADGLRPRPPFPP